MTKAYTTQLAAAFALALFGVKPKPAFEIVPGESRPADFDTYQSVEIIHMPEPKPVCPRCGGSVWAETASESPVTYCTACDWGIDHHADSHDEERPYDAQDAADEAADAAYDAAGDR